jgi:hypothetical protein
MRKVKRRPHPTGQKRKEDSGKVSACSDLCEFVALIENLALYCCRLVLCLVEMGFFFLSARRAVAEVWSSLVIGKMGHGADVFFCFKTNS